MQVARIMPQGIRIKTHRGVLVLIPQESKLWVWHQEASRRIGNSADPYTDSGLLNKNVSERPTRFTAPQIAVLTRVDIKRRSDSAT